jgi:hypothetical protein
MKFPPTKFQKQQVDSAINRLYGWVFEALPKSAVRELLKDLKFAGTLKPEKIIMIDDLWKDIQSYEDE